MSAAEMDQFAEGVVYGHRPTWSFQASRGDREAAAKRKFYPFRGESGVFEDGARRPQRRAVSRLHRAALETLGLNEDADAAAIRMRYADLVKRFHPDSNGGDRSAEAQLHKVIRAYQSLKASGWVT
jgi:DnaJ-class molecular chaperone